MMFSRMRGHSLGGIRSISVVLVISCCQPRETPTSGALSDVPNGLQVTEDHGMDRDRPSDDTTQGTSLHAEPPVPARDAFPKDESVAKERRRVPYEELRKLSREELLRRAKARAGEFGKAVRVSGPIDRGKTQQEIEEEARRVLERVERDSGGLGKLSREELFRRAKARAAEIKDEARRAARPSGPVDMGKPKEGIEEEVGRSLERVRDARDSVDTDSGVNH